MAPNTLVLKDILGARDSQDGAPNHSLLPPTGQHWASNGPVTDPNDSMSMKGTTKVKGFHSLGFGRKIWGLVIPVHPAEEDYTG